MGNYMFQVIWVNEHNLTTTPHIHTLTPSSTFTYHNPCSLQSVAAETGAWGIQEQLISGG